MTLHFLFQIVEDRTVGSGWNANRSGRNNDRRSLRRSRSRSRDRKRARRSRSRSRDRGSSRRSSRRSRSRSRDRREREADREKRKEREKKGLPPIRKAFLSGKASFFRLLLLHIRFRKIAFCILHELLYFYRFQSAARLSG